MSDSRVIDRSFFVALHQTLDHELRGTGANLGDLRKAVFASSVKSEIEGIVLPDDAFAVFVLNNPRQSRGDPFFLWPRNSFKRDMKGVRTTITAGGLIPDLYLLGSPKDFLEINPKLGDPEFGWTCFDSPKPTPESSLVTALLASKLRWIESGRPSTPPEHWLNRGCETLIEVARFAPDRFEDSWASPLQSLNKSEARFLKAAFYGAKFYGISASKDGTWHSEKKNTRANTLLAYTPKKSIRQEDQKKGRPTHYGSVFVKADFIYPSNIAIFCYDHTKRSLIPVADNPFYISEILIAVLQRAGYRGSSVFGDLPALGSQQTNTSLRVPLETSVAQPLHAHILDPIRETEGFSHPTANPFVDKAFKSIRKYLAAESESAAPRIALIAGPKDGRTDAALQSLFYKTRATLGDSKRLQAWIPQTSVDVAVDWNAFPELGRHQPTVVKSISYRFQFHQWRGLAHLLRIASQEEIFLKTGLTWRSHFTHGVFFIVGIPSWHVLLDICEHPFFSGAFVVASSVGNWGLPPKLSSSTVVHEILAPCLDLPAELDLAPLENPVVRRVVELLSCLPATLPDGVETLLGSMWDHFSQSPEYYLFHQREAWIEGRESSAQIGEVFRVLRERFWFAGANTELSPAAVEYARLRSPSQRGRDLCLWFCIIGEKIGISSGSAWYDTTALSANEGLVHLLHGLLPGLQQDGIPVGHIPYPGLIVKLARRLKWFYRQRDTPEDFKREDDVRTAVLAYLRKQPPDEDVEKECLMVMDEHAATLTARAHERDLVGDLTGAVQMGLQAERVLLSIVAPIIDANAPYNEALSVSDQRVRCLSWYSSLLLDLAKWGCPNPDSLTEKADILSKRALEELLSGAGVVVALPDYKGPRAAPERLDKDYVYFDDACDQSIISQVTDDELSRRGISAQDFRGALLHMLQIRIKVHGRMAAEFIVTKGDDGTLKQHPTRSADSQREHFWSQLAAALGACQLGIRIARAGKNDYGDLDAASVYACLAFEFYRFKNPAGIHHVERYLLARTGLCNLALIYQKMGFKHSRLLNAKVLLKFIVNNASLETIKTLGDLPA